ncbi:unnamed protein product, partial [marine sediment metagenome]
KKGFSQELHKQILIKILVSIFKEFGGKLGFKGGTCAYLFYELPRISFDLDLDLLSPFEKKDVDILKAILVIAGIILTECCYNHIFTLTCRGLRLR